MHPTPHPLICACLGFTGRGVPSVLQFWSDLSRVYHHNECQGTGVDCGSATQGASSQVPRLHHWMCSEFFIVPTPFPGHPSQGIRQAAREHQMCSGWMFRPPSHDPAAASGATPPTPSTSSPCMALGAWPASSAPLCSQPHKSVHSTALPASLPARKMRSGRRWRSSWSCLSTSSSPPTSACGPPIGSSALRFQASPECVGIHSQEHPGPKLFKSDNFAGEGLWLHSCLHGCLQLNQTVCNFIIISMRRPVPSSKPASSPSC